ncbi:uncharacterized protein N7483_005483 [Penicillium malachiteum]|uniref:uncharacterized protein n=1 Tax=Penicillium malachiteum TaxID=1324776 RepID=UPI002547A901|nr:uncharacterized protein N7483_005483 [Penicillium malachiteum]KAJ5730975.1 hypothetical protein N7483_005483 [Penicillium malachiteum]
MFPATANKISAMTKDLEKTSVRWAGEAIQFELIPIEKHHMQSRIYRGFDPHGPFKFLLTSLFNVINPNLWENVVDDRYFDDAGLGHTEAAEVAYHLKQPFYCNPPPWKDSPICNECHRPSEQFGSIPVFYLTKHLTDDEDKSIKREIYKVYDKSNYQEDSDDCWDYYDDNLEKRKYARFVPWEKQEDGNCDDIFNILVQVDKFQGLGYICDPFFCIDQESPRDNRLILVEPEIYHYGNYVQSEGEYLQGMIAPTLKGFKTI